MKYFNTLKTSERISLSFALFGFVSLLLFLVLINITYFFIWYNDQEEKSFSNMNENYRGYLSSEASQKDIEDFKWYLLTQDTIIIPEEWELICSPWVQKKIKEAPELISDRYFYRDGEKIYFIYSKYFPDIGDVKVLFDTTPYITSQLIIIKTGIIFIFIVFILQFFGGRYISGRLLKDLKSISSTLWDIDINTKQSRIVYHNMPKWDEIRILAEALNTSYDAIEIQTGKLKQFLTDVSHEFKTPLMVMNSRLDVLEKKQYKNALEQNDVKDFFSLSRQNIAKLNGLLQSLFFISKIEEQSWCLVKKNINVKNVFEQRILQVAEGFPHKSLDYSLDIDETLMYSVEENTFGVLIDNLISNAMKFSSDDMQLEIKADKKMFQIQDNGPGIPKWDREKIWEKFYRTDTNKEWFWVWLYLVKRIVDIYNWDIKIISPKKWGTIFKVGISEYV